MSSAAMKKALAKYRQFHQLDPRRVGKFPASFRIPREGKIAGYATYVLYRSDKLNPETGQDEGEIDYIHEHDPQSIVTLRCDERFPGVLRAMPRSIRDAACLVVLGRCLGYGYETPEGRQIQAPMAPRHHELYTIPSGRALLIIREKKKVVAVLYGGSLGVERRGIVG